MERLRGGLLAALIFSLAWFGWSAPETTATKPAAVPAPRAAALTTTPTIQTGAMVWLDSDSPYYAAGLRSGDLVTRGGGKPIINDADFYKVFAATTNTAFITADVLRDGKSVSVTVPAYLPADVTLSAYRCDWARYVKYYAPDARNPDPLLRKAYDDFDNRRYALAQIEFTSATKAGAKDPLTAAKLAWLLLSRRAAGSKVVVEMAGKLLDPAMQSFDPSLGDKETQSKLEGTYMLYCQAMGNTAQAASHGRKAIDLAPNIVGNRINYYTMLVEAKSFDDAAMAADGLAADFPRSVSFQRMKRTANLRLDQLKGVIEASEALVNLMPDDIPTRLQLLPFLDQINDSFGVEMHCNHLLRTKEKALDNPQKSQIHYYLARVNFRRRLYRAAENEAQETVRLRGSGEDYFLLANILHSRSKWKDAVIAYAQAEQKPWTTRMREDWRALRTRMDEAIGHLWSWQIKRLPTNLQNVVKKRKEWLAERAVLRHSFVMRNRYAIRNVLIAIGSIMILSGFVMRFLISER